MFSIVIVELQRLVLPSKLSPGCPWLDGGGFLSGQVPLGREEMTQCGLLGSER
jgi:hypothetical protein